MRPLIFIPGVLGCRLRDRRSGRVVWGNALSLYANQFFHCLTFRAEGIGEASLLECLDVIPGLWKVDIHAGFFRYLARTNRRVVGDLRSPQPQANLYGFGFNWTEDITDTARRLHEAITAVLAVSGHDQVDLIGHSYGGFVARYYSVLGCRDIDDSECGVSRCGARVARIFLLGTAQAGAIDNFRVLHEGFQFAPLAKHFGPLHAFSLQPAFYMLPAPGEGWCVRQSGPAAPALDLYCPEDWEREGWSIFSKTARDAVWKGLKTNRHHLQFPSVEQFYAEQKSRLARRLRRARRLHEILARTDVRQESPTYEVFGAHSLPTLARAVVAGRNGASRLIFPPPRRAAECGGLFCAGDGETPFASLTALAGLRPDRVHCVETEHRRLLQNARLWRVLGHRLECA